jgi:hypothetical protein
MKIMEPTSFQQTNEIVKRYLGKSSFKLSKLEEELDTKNLPMRVAPAHPVRTYLTELVEEGRLVWNSRTDTYRQLTKSESIAHSKSNPLINLPYLI